MTIPVKIRTFKFPDDFWSVVELWEQSGPGIQVERSDTMGEISKKLGRDPDLFLVAENRGEIIGAVIGGYDGRRGMIYHLAVNTEFRQRGIGSQLMVSVENRLRDKGCLRSYLMVRKENSAAHFYEANGWQPLDISMFGKDLQ